MAETLNQLERRLERLEAAVVQEYSTRKLDALRDGQDRISLDEAKLDGFAEELGQMERALYATGDPKRLQIVSEQHDAIRIRMICLQHILEREIPKPYADEALFEGGRGARAGAGRLSPTAAKAPPRTFLGRVFQRTEAPKPAPQPAAPTMTNEMRLVHLHKLMEEDRKQLMAPEERPPRMPATLPPLDPNALPPAEAAYRFKVKFVGETHLGQRVVTEKIARTPEELRAKLARRAQEDDKK